MLVELAIGAVDNEDAYAFVEKLVKEMRKQVQDIKKGSSVTLDNGTQLFIVRWQWKCKSHLVHWEITWNSQRDQEERRSKG
jgi:hypothetical protein